MNLLTLLRTNLYTQKQMGFILGMKPHNVSRLVCDLERRGYIEVERSLVQSRRAWYVVFGAERVQPGQTLIPEDAAERLHTVYEDIEPMEILGVMENYTRLRNQSIRGEHDVS